jgi:hypothetical protein
MADYCTVAEVAAELPHLTINATSKPTMAQVTTWCGDITAEMDAHFSAAGIVVPVTDATKLKVVKQIALYGVAARIMIALEVVGGGKAVDYNAMYRQRLKDVDANPAILSTPSAQKGTLTTFDPVLETEGSPGDDDYDNGRTFQRQSRQW